jgi:hypothetical protein
MEEQAEDVSEDRSVTKVAVAGLKPTDVFMEGKFMVEEEVSGTLEVPARGEPAETATSAASCDGSEICWTQPFP